MKGEAVEALQPLLDMFAQLTALDAGLFGAAVVLAVLLRLARASFRSVNGAHTFWAGLVLGVVGAVLMLTNEPRPWQVIAFQAIALGVVVLLGERYLRSLAPKVPWIPGDNDWVKDPPSSATPASSGKE
jgi:hypothetical protein